MTHSVRSEITCAAIINPAIPEEKEILFTCVPTLVWSSFKTERFFLENSCVE